ncbi:hypothetical protein LIA77_09471 [Sarocladium implicatum]|nr:hypothetical protein LIA77_09471 [Sarocladium implicatum]
MRNSDHDGMIVVVLGVHFHALLASRDLASDLGCVKRGSRPFGRTMLSLYLGSRPAKQRGAVGLALSRQGRASAKVQPPSRVENTISFSQMLCLCQVWKLSLTPQSSRQMQHTAFSSEAVCPASGGLEGCSPGNTRYITLHCYLIKPSRKWHFVNHFNHIFYPRLSNMNEIRQRLAMLVLATSPALAADLKIGDTISSSKSKDFDWSKAWDYTNTNASNTIALPSYNVSMPYSEDLSPSMTWELVLQLQADLPVPGSDDEFITATELYVVQPVELTGEMYEVLAPDNEWQTCEQWMFAVDSTRPDAPVPEDHFGGRKDAIDPQCHGVLSEGCLEALRTIAASGDCETSSVPEKCEAEVSQEYLTTGSKHDALPSRPKNDTMQNFRLIIEANSNGPHKKGDTEAYLESIKKVHVFLFGMGQPGDKKANSTGQDREMVPGSKLNSSIACIRPYVFNGESLDFDDLDENIEGAGSMLKAGVTGLSLSLLAAMAMLMLL